MCHFLTSPDVFDYFIPSILTDSHPASDDTPILSVVSPSTAASAREQQYSSELYFTTDTDWSSAATGDTHIFTAHSQPANLFNFALRHTLTCRGIWLINSSFFWPHCNMSFMLYVFIFMFFLNLFFLFSDHSILILSWLSPFFFLSLFPSACCIFLHDF